MDKENYKILSLQFAPIVNDKVANYKKVSALFKANADFDADLVLLPEIWTFGQYTDSDCTNQAESLVDTTTMLLSGLAQENNCNIVGGSILEKSPDGMFYNTSLVIDRTGAVVGQYRKNYPFTHFESQEGRYVTAGNETCVAELDGVKFGIAICYDLRFPELFRQMLKQGAEVFIIPAAWPMSRIDQWETLLKARAIENLAYVISCNQAYSGENEMGGNSLIVSPFGDVRACAEASEFVLKTIVDLNETEQVRVKSGFLNDIKF